jgi:predicted ATPase/DNA-binding SARP family transcriptional activator
MARVALSLLGPVQVSVDGATVKSFPYDKVIALLAFLVVEAGRPQRRETLAALLWPENDPAAARHSLSQALFRLRGLLADSADQPLVSVTRHTVQLSLAAEHWADVIAFRALLDRRARHQHPVGQLCSECAGGLRQAVELYRGDFLEQLSLPDAIDFDEWVLPRRTVFRDQVLNALDELIDYHDRRDELREAASCARRQVALDPYREESQRRLMSLLARSGERSAALLHYERYRQILRDELDIEPDAAMTSLVQRIRESGEGSTETPRTTSHLPRRYRLPVPLTPFVGRRTEIARLTEHLFDAKARLTTLVGPGGIGKTRLALQTAATANDSFADGACLVPLAGAPKGSRLAPAIADALALQLRSSGSPREQLLDFLHDRELLLVLDNFEHLLDEAVLVSHLLERAPGLQVVVTSRERLRLQAESVFDVEGLDVPPDRDTESLESYGAVELFIQSARRVRSSFNPDPAELQSVGLICRLVEGMPLAIELAAAWVPVLSCAEIAAEIAKGLDLLTSEIQDLPERHRSIRQVFDRSWQMLSPFDQDVFKRLSVFHGGFRREAAERIAGRALPSLTTLVSKSLLYRNARGRYEIHELLRQYAEEQLGRTPDLALDVRDQHATYYLSLLAQSAGALQSGQHDAVLPGLSAEIDNVRAGWQWAARRANAPAIATAMHGMWLFGEVTGRYAETESVFAEAIRALETAAVHDPDDEPSRALTLARLLASRGWYVYRLGGVDLADSLLDRAIDRLRRLDSPRDLGLALNFRAMGAHARQDDLGEQQYLAESIELLSRAGERWGLAYSINDLGLVRYRLGDAPEARRLCQQSLELFADSGDKRGTAYALRNVGVITFGLDDLAAARRCLTECLVIWRSLGSHWGTADALCQLGVATRSMGDSDQALRELQEALVTAAEVNAMSLALEVLAELASLRLQAGESADVTKLLAAIARHPASEPAVRNRAKSLLQTLSGDLARQLTAAEADLLVRQTIRQTQLECIYNRSPAFQDR